MFVSPFQWQMKAQPGPMTPFPASPKSAPSYGSGFEAIAVRDEIDRFKYSNSAAYFAVKQQFGTTLRFTELKGLVYAAVLYIEKKQGIQLPKMSRNTKRNFPLLIKYVQTHYQLIIPVLPKLSLYDEDRISIPLLEVHLTNS
jgi:hypothetical protein